MIHNLYKQRGETPLERIQRFIDKNPNFKVNKMTYLGRLDPLAEGVLLVASGGDTSQKRREELLGLDKEYEFTCVFGFATDTFDILGKITRAERLGKVNYMDIKKVARIYEGEREQRYPLYSSKMIAKKSLSPIPSKKITIYKLQFNGLEKLSSKELFGRILADVSKVKGDFRQEEILALWKTTLFELNLPPPLLEEEIMAKPNYYLGRFSACVSSGTYIRGIINDIGNTLGCGASVLSIKRTRVGNFQIKDGMV